jgi:hypothetical protein
MAGAEIYKENERLYLSRKGFVYICRPEGVMKKCETSKDGKMFGSVGLGNLRETHNRGEGGWVGVCGWRGEWEARALVFF